MPDPTFKLMMADAVDFLSMFDDASVDLVLTDPAYESLEKHRRRGTTTRLTHSRASSNDWFNIFPNQRFPPLLAEIYRVLRPNRHFYMFTDQETMFVVKPLAEAAGFEFHKPLVWDKLAIGMGYHYRARYELILFFSKGRRKLNNLGIADILTAKRVYRGYPTEKPINLALTLIGQSTGVGELVVDPFVGSGTFGQAALRLGRLFAGADVCAEAVDIACQRIAKEDRHALPTD